MYHDKKAITETLFYENTVIENAGSSEMLELWPFKGFISFTCLFTVGMVTVGLDLSWVGVPAAILASWLPWLPDDFLSLPTAVWSMLPREPNSAV